MNVLERLKICASGGSIVPNRKLCGDAYDEIARLKLENGALKGSLLVMEEGYQRLTAELESEKAKRGAIIEMAAKVVEDTMLTYPSGQSASDDVAAEIRALDPDATAIAELLDAETRACIEEVCKADSTELAVYGTTYIQDRLTARIDQRKEEGK